MLITTTNRTANVVLIVRACGMFSFGVFFLSIEEKSVSTRRSSIFAAAQEVVKPSAAEAEKKKKKKRLVRRV